MKMLNVGCGTVYHPDWVNADLVPAASGIMRLDVTDSWPFEAETFDVVYSSHVLEHLYPEQASHFMSEARRVLRPGGTIRLAVPDLERIARGYLRSLAEARRRRNAEAEANYDWMVLELLDQMVRRCPGGKMAEFLFRWDLPNEPFILERIGLEAKRFFDEKDAFREVVRQIHIHRSGRPLAVFGAGSLGERIAGWLKEFGYDVDFFLDNDTTKHGERREGIPVLPPSHAHEAFVIVASSWRDEIRRQLLEMGLTEPDDFVCFFQTALPAGTTGSSQEAGFHGELHRWMYDSFSLSRLLERHGFEKIAACSAFSSRIPDFDKYELDVVNGKVRKPDSLFMEASKPANG